MTGPAHTHHHCHPPLDPHHVRPLAGVMVLTGLYMLLELVGGFWIHSLALIADAGHMLTDMGAIGLALFAVWLARQKADSQKTYGYHRVEIMTAFVNGILLAGIAVYIVIEAIHRFQAPQSIHGPALTWIAVGGLLVNLVAMGILQRSGDRGVNTRAVLAHVASDALGSLAAVLAGVLVWCFHQPLADPVLSIVIALFILWNAWKLIEETVHILLEGSPAHLNVQDIRAALLDLPQVQSVHDLHVWCITSGKEALSVHVVVQDAAAFTPGLVNTIQHRLKEHFGLTHITVQLEPPGFEEDDIHF